MHLGKLVVSLLALGVAAPLTAADFAGTWHGSINSPQGGEMKLAYVFSSAGGKLTGALQIPEFGEFPMADLTIEGDAVSFRVGSDAGTWTHRGTLKDGAIAVIVTGPEGEFPLTMKRAPANIAGRWKSKFEGPDGAVDLIFSFQQDGEKLTGSVGGPWGEFPLLDGKIAGNDASWQTEWEGTRIHHVGKVEGDAMSVHVKTADWENTLTLAREKTGG